MKTKQIALIGLGVILVIAIFTNPSQEMHKEIVKSKITAYYQKSIEEDETIPKNGFSALGSLLGTSLINTLVENGVSRDNYLVFSITKVAYKGEENSIGFGAFGNVFLSDRVEEAFQNEKE
ncbi:DUF4359 domain-containing protein [Flavobacterium sp. SM15]|uniref:DUF4359 domain-containing protein n=1 Tax=Flavobacterium sp. SM15 TaxID=2908005 RepID=UPI001EDC6BEC|nr:DUF4359 domain-containing protein [Flavobacterium sp. SM15]MCG2611807.1 DUF4359 domain-containing protein [Flavobacterium sp. SM15]